MIPQTSPVANKLKDVTRYVIELLLIMQPKTKIRRLETQVFFYIMSGADSFQA